MNVRLQCVGIRASIDARKFATPRRRLQATLGTVGIAICIVAIGAGLWQPSAYATTAVCPNAAFRSGPSADLPDCRAYEQVSPPEKHGAAAITPDYPAQASPNGEALADVNFFAATSGAQSASFPDAYVARRTAHGWQTANVSPPTPDPTPSGADEVTYLFSEDLSNLVTTVSQQILANNATPEVYNLFDSGTSGALSYSWINDAPPLTAPPAGCPPSTLVACFQLEDVVTPAGASANFGDVLFEGNGSLVAGAPERRQNLYESSNEGGSWHVSLVGILPDGAIPAQGSTAGSGSKIFYKTHNNVADERVANAISSTGAQVVFQAASDEGVLPAEAGQGGLTEVYDRVNGDETVELSAPMPGAKPSFETAERAQFWAASADGAHVFFTSSAELTTSSYTGSTEPKGEDLYEYSLGTKKLKDLTVDSNLPNDSEEGAAVQGVLGVSSNGAYVYFVARGELVPGKGVDHADNLYVIHNGGAAKFIATLSESDSADWQQQAALLESYVTPDGTHLAFTSVASLPTLNFPSGYDNVNEASHNPEREIYEYAAAPAGEEESLPGSLICVSCDPSGASPIGPGLLGSVGRGESSEAGSTTNSAFHQVRTVSDNGGRVFFSSKDPLVKQNSGNTQAKIYEYEWDGEGTCNEAAGCVYLLSDPNSSEEAFFLDADNDGANVFIATSSELTASDHDNLIDVYDVRIDGGSASPAIDGSCHDSCREEVGGEALTTFSPLTSFMGASGNLRILSSTYHRSGRHAHALKSCRKGRKHPHRRACVMRARARQRVSSKANGHDVQSQRGI